MGACELPNGIYYVLDHDKDINDLESEIVDTLSEEIARVLYKRIKDLRQYISRRELEILIYDAFAEYFYEYKDSVINTKKGYHTGFTYIDEYDPINISETIIEKIWDLIEIIIERDIEKSIIENAIFDALNNSSKKIEKLLKEYSIGIVKAYCHWGFGYVSIIEDPYGKLQQIAKIYDE